MTGIALAAGAAAGILLGRWARYRELTTDPMALLISTHDRVVAPGRPEAAVVHIEAVRQRRG